MANLSSKLAAVVRLSLYALITLLLMPVQLLLNAINSPKRRALPKLYHRACLKILGLRIIRRGRPSAQGPTLFVANHTSYMDITILGALLKASFVAKDEVKSWPFFGWCARLQQSVFINRQSRDALTHAGEIQRRLLDGDSIILFPEGTTGDGQHVLPFKSALLSVAALDTASGAPLTVQPVSVAYSRLDGLPMGRGLRANYAWFGDMSLGPHILNAAGLGLMTVIVEFHPTVTLAQFKNRKELSDYCYEQIADGVAEGITVKAQRRPRRDRMVPHLLNESAEGKKRLTDPL